MEQHFKYKLQWKMEVGECGTDDAWNNGSI